MNFTKKFFILSTFLLCGIFIFGVGIYLNSLQNEKFSTTVNIAGRQRMLSQKIARIFLEYSLGKDEGIRKELIKLQREIQNTHQYLLRGNNDKHISSPLNGKIKEELKQLSLVLNDLTEHSSCFHSKCSTEIAINTSDKFLNKMNKIVFLMSEHIKRVEITQNYFKLGFLAFVIISMFLFYVYGVLPEQAKLRRKIVEAKRSEKVVKNIIDFSPVGILVLNSCGKVLRTNRIGSKILDESKRNVVGKSIEDVDLRLWEHINSSNRKEVIRLKNKDVEISIAKMDELIVCVLEDITNENILKRERDVNSQMASVGILTSGVAHELKNPLSILKMAIQMLEKKSDQKDLVGKVRNSMERIVNLVDQIHSFSKSCSTTYKNEILNVKNICEMAKTLTIGEVKKISKIEVEAEEGLILANEGKVVQVLINLIINASHAFKEESSHNLIKIRSYFEEKVSVIEVIDNASGISEENLVKIFDTFFTTKGKDKGTGLGLSISKETVESFNGKIEVESRIDVGTTFRLHFPKIVDNKKAAS